MYEILRKGRFHNLSISCQYHLFEKIVTPILLYGCEIWGSSNTEILEKVHLKFCKLLLNLKRSTPNYMIYGELGTYPLSTLIKQRIVNFWAKLVNANNSDKISAILYRFSYQKFDSGEFRSKWLLNVKDILDKNGLSYLFFENELPKDWLKETIKTRIKDQFTQLWTSEVFNSPKSITYRVFKEKLEFEEYLDLLDKKERNIICKFRTSNHKLPIETGRWFGIERNMRKCHLCDQNELGDEFHYIFQCPVLRQSRKINLIPEYRNNGNMFKLKNYFNLKTL